MSEQGRRRPIPAPDAEKVFDIMFCPNDDPGAYVIERLKTREEAEKYLSKTLENPEQVVREAFPDLAGPYEKDQFSIDEGWSDYLK